MKVLLINNFHYRRGGSETIYLETGKMLEIHGHQVIYFSFWDELNIHCNQSKYFPKRSVNTIIGGINYFYNRSAQKKLEELIQDEKPDIAHIHLLWGGLTGSIFKVLKKYNIPIVHTTHDQRMICPAYIFRNGFDEICEKCKPDRYYMCIANKCSKKNRILSLIMTTEMYFRNTFVNPIKHIDGFIFVSKFSESKHLEFNTRFLHTNRLQLYNFTEGEDKCIIRKGNYYLYYGRLSEEKGLYTLVNTFKTKKNLSLYIVGTGPLEEPLRNLIRDDRINNITLLGFKSGEELFNLIQNSKCVVVPSECYENNPMTVIESYSYSTPVIGAHIGGIPEIVIHNETGYTFESGNIESLSYALDNFESLSDEKYDLFSQNAYNFYCANFHKDKYYDKLINFYSQIIKSYNLKR